MPSAARTIWQLTEGHRARYATALAALVAASGLAYLVPLLPQAVLDGVLIDDGSHASAFTRRIVDWLGGTAYLRTHLWLPAILMVGIAALAGLCTHVRTRLSASASEAVALRLRDRLYDHLQRLACSTLDQRQSGD